MAIDQIFERPDWDHYFMDITVQVARRSTCLRRAVGAIAVKDKRILSTGYNGAPSGHEDCLQRGYCEREIKNVPSGMRHEICRGLHAEQNGIIQAAYHGVSIKDSTYYSTTFPCVICFKMIENAGIKEIVYLAKYDDKMTEEFLAKSNIITRKLDDYIIDPNDNIRIKA